MIQIKISPILFELQYTSTVIWLTKSILTLCLLCAIRILYTAHDNSHASVRVKRVELGIVREWKANFWWCVITSAYHWSSILPFNGFLLHVINIYVHGMDWKVGRFRSSSPQELSYTSVVKMTRFRLSQTNQHSASLLHEAILQLKPTPYYISPRNCFVYEGFTYHTHHNHHLFQTPWVRIWWHH